MHPNIFATSQKSRKFLGRWMWCETKQLWCQMRSVQYQQSGDNAPCKLLRKSNLIHIASCPWKILRSTAYWCVLQQSFLTTLAISSKSTSDHYPIVFGINNIAHPYQFEITTQLEPENSNSFIIPYFRWNKTNTMLKYRCIQLQCITLRPVLNDIIIMLEYWNNMIRSESNLCIVLITVMLLAFEWNILKGLARKRIIV